MPFWKRSSPSTPVPGDGIDLRPGILPCSMGDCPHDTGLPCAYVDRRGKACDTAWCPEHRLIAQAAVYCRRHYGTVTGLTGAEDTLPLPDRDNRAPSLVAWVSRRVEPAIQAMLLEHRRPGDATTVVTLPVHLVFVGRERLRAWERTWALADHTGHRISVILQVEEERSTELVIRVQRNVVTRVVPPWIEARLAGEELPPELDSARRREFYEFVQRTVAGALARAELPIA
jgi:hypothetical protein